MRTAKELLIASKECTSKEFASEDRWLNAWHLGSSLAVFGTLIVLAAVDLPWKLRIASRLAAGLVTVRLFIIYTITCTARSCASRRLLPG